MTVRPGSAPSRCFASSGGRSGDGWGPGARTSERRPGAHGSCGRSDTVHAAFGLAGTPPAVETGRSGVEALAGEAGERAGSVRGVLSGLADPVARIRSRGRAPGRSATRPRKHRSRSSAGESGRAILAAGSLPCPALPCSPLGAGAGRRTVQEVTRPGSAVSARRPVRRSPRAGRRHGGGRPGRCPGGRVRGSPGRVAGRRSTLRWADWSRLERIGRRLSAFPEPPGGSEGFAGPRPPAGDARARAPRPRPTRAGRTRPGRTGAGVGRRLHGGEHRRPARSERPGERTSGTGGIRAR